MSIYELVNGGPAFPIDIGNNTVCTGMTLRDYFAAKAMQAMLSRPDASAENIEGLKVLMEFVACQAYATADAMVAASRVVSE